MRRGIFSGVAGLRVSLSLCHCRAWRARRSQSAAGGASLRQPVPLQVNQLLDPAREVPAEAVHVELSVDLRAALAQACAECGRRLFPTPCRQGRLQALAHPCHRGLMQHDFLHVPGLQGQILRKLETLRSRTQARTQICAGSKGPILRKFETLRSRQQTRTQSFCRE